MRIFGARTARGAGFPRAGLDARWVAFPVRRFGALAFFNSSLFVVGRAIRACLAAVVQVSPSAWSNSIRVPVQPQGSAKVGDPLCNKGDGR